MALTFRNGVWHWRKIIKGQHFARSTKTGDKRDAERIAAMWEGEATHEIMVKGQRPMYLHAVIKAFLDARKGTGGYANAKVHLAHFQKLPDIKLFDVTLEQLQGVINARREAGTSHNTLVVTVSYWNAVVAFAQDKKWGTAVRLPRMENQKTRIRWLDADEEARLFAAIDPKASYPGKCKRTDKARQDNTDLLLMLLHLGCRYREAARMTWSQVDLTNKKLLVIRGKGGIDGMMVMSDKLHAVLTRRYAERVDEWVFPTKRRHNNNYKWLGDALERAGIEAGKGKVTLHVARHTFATRMLGSGMSLVEVKQLLGHKNIQSTMVYAHVETGKVAEAAAKVLNAVAA